MLPRRLFFFWVKEKLVRFYQFLSIRLRSASCVTRCASRCLYSCNTLSTNAHHRLRCSRRTQPRLRGARNREHRRASIRRCFFLFHCSVHCSTKSVLVRRRRCWYRPSLVRKTCCYTCDHRRQSVSTVGVTAGFIPRILDYGTKMGNFMHQSQTVCDSYVPKTEMAANDSCCCISESIITHCSPDVVVIHFKDKKSCELRPPTSRTVNDRFNILVHSLAELQQSNRQMSINQLRHLMYNLDVTGILW